MERIEIIRGHSSAQYGSAAMGGVINVITKQGKEKPGAFVEGVLGSWGHEEWSIGGSGKYDKFDFSGSYTKYGISISDYDSFSTMLNFAYIGEADDFTVADFMISKRILNTERYGGLTLRGEINNLFDKDYEYRQGYPMPGRSFFIGMRYYR